MSHILIIKDAAGKELARVPVKGGYTIQEMKVPSEVTERMTKPDKAVDAGDGGKGKGSIS